MRESSMREVLPWIVVPPRLKVTEVVIINEVQRGASLAT